MDDSERFAVWKILDASANRAVEGMRTLEDYARFVVQDAFLTSQLKSLRHELAIIVSKLSRDARQQARDTMGDVGTSISNDTEVSRASLSDVLIAAIERVQQSIRSLEEYSKLQDPDVARQFEACRYRCYTVFAAVESSLKKRFRLAGCQLYVLVDGSESSEKMVKYVTRLAEAGVDLVQLRDKRLNDAQLYERSCAAVAALRSTKTLFIVNDRPDIAAASGADGVHVGQDEMPVTAARRIVGGSAIIGVSTHTITEARSAVLDGADYIGCGPTFPSTTKFFHAYPGLDFLREVAAELTLPAFAIGGIDESNLKEVIRAGFRRIAVAGAMAGRPDLATHAAALKHQLASEDLTATRTP